MQFKRNLIFSVLVAAILFTFQAQAKDRGPLVRVKVGETTTEFVLVPKKYMQVSCYRKGRLICNYHAYTPLTLRPGQNGIQLEQEGGVLESGLEEVICTPRRSGSSISINGKSYRGRLRILINSQPNTLLAINQVRVEDYLKGVVPLEMGIRLITTPEDREALKVQAVAARTYALAKLGQYPDRPYDLESTVADQVYGGAGIEEGLINRAISKTAGEVLVNDNHLVKAYFHANCGGHTENIERAWPWKEAESYLIARPDSEYCNWAKNYSWNQSWTKNELEESISRFLGGLVKDSTFHCGNLQDLQVKERSESGRFLLLGICTDQGEWDIKSDSIRWCFRKTATGPILPSSKFELSIFRNREGAIDSVSLAGFGNGHGVGMCQIGALGRARAGQSYRQILAFYYPGAALTRRY